MILVGVYLSVSDLNNDIFRNMVSLNTAHVWFLFNLMLSSGQFRKYGNTLIFYISGILIV